MYVLATSQFQALWKLPSHFYTWCPPLGMEGEREEKRELCLTQTGDCCTTIEDICSWSFAQRRLLQCLSLKFWQIVEYPLWILWEKFNFLLLRFQASFPVIILIPPGVWHFAVSLRSDRTGGLMVLSIHWYTFANSFQDTCPKKSPQVAQSSQPYNSYHWHVLWAPSHASTYGEKSFPILGLSNGLLFATTLYKKIYIISSNSQFNL